MPRLPRVASRDDLPEPHRPVWDYLERTRGAVSPGFAVLLHGPAAAGRVAELGTYIRFESSLPPAVRELTALTASVELDGIYEQAIHTRDAQGHGVASETVEAIVGRRELPAGTPADQALAVRCARELAREHRLSDASFAEARAAFGEAGVVDLVATAGYYALLAFLHNAFEIRPGEPA